MMPVLDLVEEKREQALIRITARNQVIARYYDKKFRPWFFKVLDLILKKVLVQEPGLGLFGPKWDGPYRITEIIRLGTYCLADQDDICLRHPWNADHLKHFYLWFYFLTIDVKIGSMRNFVQINLMYSYSRRPWTTEKGPYSGHRPELDLGQFQRKPEPTVGGIRAGPNVKSAQADPVLQRSPNHGERSLCQASTRVGLVSIPRKSQANRRRCPNRTQRKVCSSRPCTPEVPGPRRKVPMLDTDKSWTWVNSKETRANHRRCPSRTQSKVCSGKLTQQWVHKIKYSKINKEALKIKENFSLIKWGGWYNWGIPEPIEKKNPKKITCNTRNFYGLWFP